MIINYMRAFMKDYEFPVFERKLIIDKMFIIIIPYTAFSLVLLSSVQNPIPTAAGIESVSTVWTNM
jgi:hypothetical protein